MARTMKAAVCHAFGKPLTVEEVPVPQPRPHEVLIKVQACGVCHTDLHAISGDWPAKPTLPFIPGHEGAGVVAAVGKEVDFVREGDRVGLPWLYSACGHCDHCMAGWETLCKDQKNSGYSVNGAFAEYVVADPRFVGHLPDSVDFAAVSPVLCAGVTVYKGLKETEAKPGQWVVISGCGGLGHMAIQYAVAMGLHVAAVDVDQMHLDLAKKLGAKVTVNAKQVDPVAAVQKDIGGAHGVLVTAPFPKAFEQAMGMVRRGGTVALNGLPPGSFPLNIFDMVMNGTTVRGSIVGTRLDLKEALQFAGEGKVKAEVKTEKLENINAVLEKMRHGQIAGRVALDFRS